MLQFGVVDSSILWGCHGRVMVAGGPDDVRSAETWHEGDEVEVTHLGSGDPYPYKLKNGVVTVGARQPSDDAV